MSGFPVFGEDFARRFGGAFGQGGGSGPVNTIAPAITAAVVIGTQITGDDGTWIGATSFTYQWQRNTGSWVNISGATNKNYTPVDADFGYALRLVVTANVSTSANSNATNLTLELPAQSLSAELLANPNFTNWTGDNPDNWTVNGEVGADPMVTQVDSGGGAGTGAARFYSSATANAPSLFQFSLLTLGTYYLVETDLSAYTAGQAQVGDNGTEQFIAVAVGLYTMILRATGVHARSRAFSATPADFVINSESYKTLTPNAQLTAPSANPRITHYYTLPASPKVGDSLRLYTRVSDFALGNYWLTLLEYTGTQWNITLYSVVTFVRTSRIAATNIGASNGMRVNMNGDAITLETTADGGSNWTSRGSVSLSLYNTATGVNALKTLNFAFGNLQYEAAV